MVQSGRWLKAYVRFRTGGGYAVALTAWILGWMIWNAFAQWSFDVYPFVLLNLLLSIEASYVLPFIAMNKRQMDEASND